MTASQKPRYWKALKYYDGQIVSAHDKSPWIIGEWREVPEPTQECVGLNCCESIIDAMRYVNMEVLAEVEIDGKRIDGDNKITVQRMRIIRAWQWTLEDTVLLIAYETKLYLEHLNKESRLNETLSKKQIESAKMLIENPTYKNMVASTVLLAGGVWDAAGYVGVSDWLSLYVASAAYAGIGARLEFRERAIFFKSAHKWIVKHTTDMELMTP